MHDTKNGKRGSVEEALIEMWVALPAENKRYTFADVLTWDENERIEIFRQLADYLEGEKV